MDVGIVTLAFNEERFIHGCIKQFTPFKLPHLVLINNKPWRGEYTHDNTRQIAKDLGAIVKVDNFVSETQQRNFGQAYFKNMQWVLVVDADERYTTTTINNMLMQLRTSTSQIMKSSKMYVYYKNNRLIIDQQGQAGERGPIIAIRPSVKFYENRLAQAVSKDFKDIDLHHFSYARTDQEMKKKIDTFSHSHEIIKDWYQNKFVNYKPEQTDLHPVNPSMWHKAIKSNIPGNIKCLL